MRWITLYTESANVHLTKDVGLIPYYLYLQHGVDATLVTYKNDEDYPFSRNQVKGLKIDFLENAGKLFFLERAVIQYLKSEAKKIDVLNLYHLDRDTLYYGNLYKKYNPQGKLYLKMDAINNHFIGGKLYSKNPVKNYILKNLEKRFLKNVDLVSIENQKGLELLNKQYPVLSDKSFYMPNGVHDVNINSIFPDISKSNIENILLSVGKPGDIIKNYELLLQALPMLNLKDWKIVVIGPITNEFQEVLTQFFERNPQYIHQVIFKGEITEREKLFSWYHRAAAFFLPSREESFGIAFSEALYFGNYLIGNSNMVAFDDLSRKGEFGSLYEDNDPQSFAATLQDVIDGKIDVERKFAAAKAHGKENFVWSKLVSMLYQKVRKL